MSLVEPVKQIDSLKSKVSGNIVLPGDEGYAAAIFRYSDIAVKNAGAIVYVRDEKDVSEALKFAKQNGVDVAVCGGKHGFRGSSTEGGLVIDLGKMRKVKVDVENKTVTAQGGCLWEDVDNAAWKEGFACVGGTVSHTGIGGLTLGGGYGYLAPAKGLVVDNLLAATVVLADGRIVKTSLTEEPELFWAIRGGGGNFGVVTEFVYRAHDQKHNVFAGMLVFPVEKAEEVLALAQEYSDESDGNSVLNVGLARPPPVFQPMILAVIFFNGTEKAGREHFKDLFALGPVVDSTKEIPYPVLNTMLNDFAIPGGRKMNRGANFTSIEPAFFAEIKREYMNFTELNPPPDTSILVLFEFYPHKNIDRFKNRDMAFCNRGKRYAIAMIGSWKRAEDDELMINFTRKLIDMTQEEEKKKNGGRQLSGSLFYSNYGFGDEKDHTRVYGENYARLQELKKVYDPTSLFNKWYVIAPVE